MVQLLQIIGGCFRSSSTQTPRFVFDSNVLVAAYNWPGGVADLAYLLLRAARIELHTSAFIFGEVERILREKFDWEADRVGRAAARIRRAATITQDPESSVDVIGGAPTDNRILECALAARVDYTMTGDKKYLLPLGTFQSVSIVGLRDFLPAFSAD